MTQYDKSMITYTTSSTDKELAEILALQKVNLKENITENEMNSQGFLTVSHTLQDLKTLNNYENHLIIKDDEIVIGYILAMTAYSKHDIPILIPMFEIFDKINYMGRLISAYNYIVIGQVCIGKNYRGQGILYHAYVAYKSYFSEKYDFAITEISTSNTRSLNAHKKAGFSEIYTYTDSNDIEWSVVIWDWSSI